MLFVWYFRKKNVTYIMLWASHINYLVTIDVLADQFAYLGVSIVGFKLSIELLIISQ
jgi:hypothetical protein